MSDVDGGAAAPADTAPAPAAEQVVQTPNPVSTEGEPQQHAPEPKRAPTAREALEAAQAKIEKGEADKAADKAADKPKPVESAPKEKAEEKPAEKAADKPEPRRDETGKFASDKPAEPEKPVETPKAKYEVPARFSDDAKQIWASAPEPIQREIDRAVRELTQGHEKYKASAEAFEPIRQYHEMAAKSGTTLANALQAYTSMETLLRQDPIKGLELITSNIGLSLRDVAAHIMGQPVDQQQSAKDAEIRDLKQTIQRLEQGFTSFKGDLETREVNQIISAFKADPKYSRFDELQTDIGMFLQTGRAQNLSEAYAMAERLNPATTPAAASPPAASTAAIEVPAAQTDKGTKSITGAPSAGSTPGARKPAKSSREAIERAFARAG